MMEYLVAAAIKFRMLDDSYDTVMTDTMHANILEKMYMLHIQYDKSSAIQGFWTSNSRFVDRYEAKWIAVAANQLIVPEEETHAELFSEDVG